MAIELTTEALPARTQKQGSDIFTLAAGKSLKIETSPGGSEYLDAEVPAGKSWQVTVSVHITETDA